MHEAPRILVVRRDNIGDLVCTLPIFEGIRRHCPDAHVGALVNSYNVPLLQGNPYIDRVHVYTKSKHAPDAGRLAIARDRLRLIAELRTERYDVVLHAGSRPRAEMRGLTWLSGISRQILDRDQGRPVHEIDRVYALLHALGAAGAAPAPRLELPRQKVADVRDALAKRDYGGAIGLHISAREDENRWPLENFESLIRIGAERGLRFVLFWAPGESTRPEHPGDDDRARALLGRCRAEPVIGYPTENILELAAGLAAVRRLVGSDGGHIHIAAAVGTPVVGLYCGHKVARWRPQGPSHRVLEGERVARIPVGDVIDALFQEPAILDTEIGESDRHGFGLGTK